MRKLQNWPMVPVIILFISFMLAAGCSKGEEGNAGGGQLPEEAIPFYKWGTVLRFQQGGNAGPYLAAGWNPAEPEFTWTDGHLARINFTVDETEYDVLLKTTLAYAFLESGALDQQRVNIIVNGSKVDEWVLSEGYNRERTVIIPASLLSDTNLEIAFELPDAESPQALGLSDDPRLLAISLVSMALYEYHYAWGSQLRFGLDGEALLYQQGGWGEPEGQYQWTDGTQASILLPVARVDSQLVLKINALPFLGEGLIDEQRVVIVVNGHKAGEWKINEKKFHDLTVTFPPDYLDGDFLEVVFEFPDAASPAELGLSDDGRTLGLLFKTLTITTAK